MCADLEQSGSRHLSEFGEYFDGYCREGGFRDGEGGFRDGYRRDGYGREGGMHTINKIVSCPMLIMICQMKCQLEFSGDKPIHFHAFMLVECLSEIRPVICLQEMTAQQLQLQQEMAAQPQQLRQVVTTLKVPLAPVLTEDCCWR